MFCSQIFIYLYLDSSVLISIFFSIIKLIPFVLTLLAIAEGRYFGNEIDNNQVR